MSVLTVRSHRRYALRMPAKLQGKNRQEANCLLIELSQHGARVSNLGERAYETGEFVTLQTRCGKTLEATVRWAHDGLAGLYLTRSLHLPELSEMLDANRNQSAAA